MFAGEVHPFNKAYALIIMSLLRPFGYNPHPVMLDSLKCLIQPTALAQMHFRQTPLLSLRRLTTFAEMPCVKQPLPVPATLPRTDFALQIRQ